MLGAADDASGDSCTDGFQYQVVASVGAADGTLVELHGAALPSAATNPPMLGMAQMVKNGQVTFSNIQLSEGTTTLSLRIGGVMCAATVTVTIDCHLPM